jgi:biotin transport system substrate-specific component
MARTAQAVPQSFDRSSELAQQALIVVGASLLITLCAKVSIPLPFTPVPLSLVNFGVLLVGLVLGSKRGFAACALYLAQGAAG